MTNQQDIGLSCFVAVIGGLAFWLTSFGVGMILLTIKQAIGVSVLCGIVGFISSNWIITQIDNIQRWNRNRKEK